MTGARTSLENHKWLKVSLKIQVRTPLVKQLDPGPGSNCFTRGVRTVLCEIHDTTEKKTTKNVVRHPPPPPPLTGSAQCLHTPHEGTTSSKLPSTLVVRPQTDSSLRYAICWFYQTLSRSKGYKTFPYSTEHEISTAQKN